MELPQTIIAAAFVLVGVAFSVMGSRKHIRTDLRTPLMTPRGKLALGFVLIFIGAMVFLSQFVGPRPPGAPMRKGASRDEVARPVAILMERLRGIA
jgi:hypothetical protein